ncbi:Factor arrest protein 11 [Candida viswanathii]|uniref:Factor arrest protein 11 n=1 Tax=Candida viswanathii TaxID=5486 RepID=A0A367YI91_9ASCO|nr:Factor arrest protein 11 [Candida viswanathii]
MQLEELILIDQLEDQIIDHPDASTKEELNESLDETFQKKLNARASQIRSNNNESRNQPKETNQDSSSVNYQIAALGSGDQRVVYLVDLKVVGGLNNLISCYETENGNIDEIIRHVKAFNKLQEVSSSLIKALLYFSFGEYASKPSKSEQVEQIQRNTLYLLKKDLYVPLISIVQTFMEERIDYDKINDEKSGHCLQARIGVLSALFLELGDSRQLERCDDFLVQLHQVQNKKSKEKLDNTLTCSPLDYFNIRRALEEDDDTDADSASIHSHSSTIEGKYRYFMAVHSCSNSLSNLIEPPKTTKSHSVLSQLPIQTVHIATPVPSPKLMASDYMSGGEKIRRSYQVNQAMPMIYPNGDDNTLNVPFAMKEADEILKKAVYESYSTKRLWKEREIFMRQERGLLMCTRMKSQSDEFEYDYHELKARFPDRKREIEAMERVELLYSNNLSRLHTIVEVLMETIKVNKLDYNLNFAELELTRKHLSYRIRTLAAMKKPNGKLNWFCYCSWKSATSRIDFKGKYEHFCKLRKKDELTEYEILINQNKLMNPKISLAKCDFFNNCLQTNLENCRIAGQYEENNVKNVHIMKMNENFAYILSNILKITNKILIKNQSQRIFTLNDLKPLIVQNDSFELRLCCFNIPILKTLKKLIPQIYLNLKLSMKDNWLSGKDLESDSITPTIKRLPCQMEMMGYQVKDDIMNIPQLDLNAMSEVIGDDVDDDDFDFENETVLDRLRAIASLTSSVSELVRAGVNNGGKFLLLGVPLALAILSETQLQEMERGMALEKSAQDVLAPGSEAAFGGENKQ